jgi:hypothetical protein
MLLFLIQNILITYTYLYCISHWLNLYQWIYVFSNTTHLHHQRVCVFHAIKISVFFVFSAIHLWICQFINSVLYDPHWAKALHILDLINKHTVVHLYPPNWQLVVGYWSSDMSNLTLRLRQIKELTSSATDIFDVSFYHEKLGTCWMTLQQVCLLFHRFL